MARNGSQRRRVRTTERNMSRARFSIYACSIVALTGAGSCGRKVSPPLDVTPEALRFVLARAPSTGNGQSATLLPSGQWLLLGGDSAPAAASVLDPKTGQKSQVGSLIHPRSGHTATALPDGSVLVLGGVDERGERVRTAELFDANSGRFNDISGLESLSRAQHTATLLSDGNVLILGGRDGTELPAAPILWNAFTHRVARLQSALEWPRREHVAALLPDGMVLVAGGVDAAGEPVKVSEMFNPRTHEIARFDEEENSK